jgi:hypothetical protein
LVYRLELALRQVDSGSVLALVAGIGKVEVGMVQVSMAGQVRRRAGAILLTKALQKLK